MRSIYLTLLILCSTSGLYASEQARSETAVTPDLTGDSGILFWTPDQQVTGYSSMAELYPTRSIQGHPAPPNCRKS